MIVPDHGENVAHLTPDDDVFKHLAATYANAHPTMHQGTACPGTDIAFPNGITNGAAWYKVKGIIVLNSKFFCRIVIQLILVVFNSYT